MGGNAFFQRVATSLIIPVTILPVAAVLVAVGVQGGIPPLEEAGMALIRFWLPLFFGLGISVGFTGEAMGALSVTAGFATMTSVASAVAGDPTLHVGVLGGIVVGAVCTWLYHRVRERTLPEFLALFSGRRLGPLVAVLAGVPLGYLFGLVWPRLQQGILLLGEWVHRAGGAGAFVYGAVLRALIPTGLHHILIQLVDTQLGGWADPGAGQVVMGEYLRFLAGDPDAGRILSGFFLTLGFAPVGAALALIHEARPDQRRRVAGLMTAGILSATVLGVTEPVEFAFIFASPLLYGLHVLLSGLASLVAWTLDIHLGGYALPMILVNWHRQQNGMLLLPLGLVHGAIYYLLFRAVIRWRRPPVLGQVASEEPATAEAGPMQPAAVRDGSFTPFRAPAREEEAFLAALGGRENLLRLEACMTRLRVSLRDPERVDEQRLRSLGVAAVLRSGPGEVQVVVGTRAGELADRMRNRMREGQDRS